MPNPNRTVPDSKIIELHCNGKSYTEIGKDLKLSRQLVARVVKKYVEHNVAVTDVTLTTTGKDAYRAAVKVELTREHAISEHAKQIMEYTTEFEKAIRGGDPEMASRWAALRLKCAEMMFKATGLYDERRPDPDTEQKKIVFEDA